MKPADMVTERTGHREQYPVPFGFIPRHVLPDEELTRRLGECSRSRLDVAANALKRTLKQRERQT